MSLATPSIDSRLVGIAPGFRALSILVEAAPITQPEVAPAALAQACQQMLNDDVPSGRKSSRRPRDEVFKAFGAKPKRTPCSASALRKRVMRDGSLPPLDPVVDIYNAISIPLRDSGRGRKSGGLLGSAAPDAGRRQRAV